MRTGDALCVERSALSVWECRFQEGRSTLFREDPSGGLSLYVLSEKGSFVVLFRERLPVCMRRDWLGPFHFFPPVRVGLLLVLVGGLLGACSPSSFLGRQYTNFTAYYNTFYNAEKAFEKGVTSMERGSQPIDRTRYISIFLAPTEGGDEAAFEKAIQKSADVLREHPESKWVDDALLLIGKSYFYQQNYVGAAQKFRETISLGGERAKEARFWLTRTLVSTQRYDEAEAVIREGVKGAPLGPWTARLYLVRGELLVQRAQWEEAAQVLNRGLQGGLPDEVGGRGSFLLGQVLETIGNSRAAKAAYQSVQEYDPRYELDFAARLSEIELQGRHGNTERALDRLRDLETDEKNYERRGEMAIVRARIYRAQGQNDRARRILKQVLAGKEAPSGAARGRLHYNLAEIYRNAYEDFSRAAAHFDTASTTLDATEERASGERRRMPGAPVDPEAKASRYRDLAEQSRAVARMDSLLRVGRMNEQEFQAFVKELRRRRQEKRAARREQRAQEQNRQQLGGRRGRTLADQRRQAAPAADTRESDAGFLFYNDPARVQQGRRQFERTWGDRPLVDNWRRRNAISTSGTASSEGGGEQEAPGATASAGTAQDQRSAKQEAALDLSAIPRDSASRAEMEAERAVARYKLANSLFLAAGRPDSAATWYRRILQEDGDQPVAKRALYALAEAYQAQGDTTAAQQTYRQLVEQYPKTDLAARARRRLGEQETTAAADNRALADTAYAQAYAVWEQGQMDAALPKLLDVAAQYPDTDAAPRALLAAGIAYWKQVQRDSTTASRPVLTQYLHSVRRADSSLVSQDSSVVDSAQNPSGADSMRVLDPGAADSADTVAEGGDALDGRTAGEDSMRVPERGADASRTSPQPRDTLRAVRQDSTGRPDRQAREAPDSARVPADSMQQSENAGTKPDKYTPLESLLTYLMERYPEARQVERAQVIAKLIERQRAPDSVRSDTTTQGRPIDDTTTAVPRTVAEEREKDPPPPKRDSLRASQRATASDSERSPAERQADDRDENAKTEDRDFLPAPTGGGRQSNDAEAGKESIDRSRGGWTLLVQTFTASEEASTRVAEVGRKLENRWPVDLLKEEKEGNTTYRLVVGQFQDKTEAARVQERIEKQLSRRPEVWALSESEGRS